MSEVFSIMESLFYIQQENYSELIKHTRKLKLVCPKLLK